MGGERLRIVDSHTGGEPTRVIVSGGPDLGTGSAAQRRDRMRVSFDRYRTAINGEPRSSEIVVGAILIPPSDPSACAGVIFFNNVGYLGMCGHGTIGVAVTLAYLGQIEQGSHLLETPVGPVRFEYDGTTQISFENVPSYRYRAGVPVVLENGRIVTGDIAWGGNWFFLTKDVPCDIAPERIADLLAHSRMIRRALLAQNITGAKGEEIDHVELMATSYGDAAHDHAEKPSHAKLTGAINFVLCPGIEFDRSPCGTGTSAKLACLAADRTLAIGETWVQESVIGSRFVGSYREPTDPERQAAGPLPGDADPSAVLVIPRITGEAHINLDATVIIDPADPFAWGFSTSSTSRVNASSTIATGVST